MKLLLRAAFRNGKRFALLIITFSFMCLHTVASQMEMLALGVVMGTGADFFALFSSTQKEKEKGVAAISLEDVRSQWHEIAAPGSDVITKQDAARYVASRKDRNPLTRIMSFVSARSSFLEDLTILAVVLVLVAILKGISLFGSQYSRQLVMIRVSRDLRQTYFEHIQRMPLEFYNRYNVASLSTRASGDAAQVATAVYAAMVSYIQTPFAVLSSLLLCFYVSVELSLLMFVCFPLIILPILYFAKRIKRVSRRLLRNQETYSSALLDALSGIQTIKLFAIEKFSLKKFREQNERLAHLEEKSARYGFLARPVLHIASTIILAGIILYGLYFAHLSVSEILVFCGLVYLMYEPIKRLNDENIQINRGIAAAERMYEVLDQEPKITDHPHAVAFTEFKESIEFENVWFRYEDQWVLSGLSFTARRGEVVALVGPTGTGKSTVAQLLPRLYEPQQGCIRIDGNPLASYTQQSLRERIAFVPQRPFLFIDTVLENIAFGRDYSLEEVQEAARRAHADEFIKELAQGYHTVLNEGGKNLSGGQQQRIAIARALVRKAPILIMDEATSSLDAISEGHIKQAISELRGEVTQILIAHRLSTIEHADRILYLEKGQLVAQGTKDELLKSCPPFRMMWEMMHGGVSSSF